MLQVSVLRISHNKYPVSPQYRGMVTALYEMKRCYTSLAGQPLPVRSIPDAATLTHDAVPSHNIPPLQPPRTPSHPPCVHLFPFHAGFLSDLHAFDPLRLAWTDLTAAAAPWPPARAIAGIVAVAGRLLVHGGIGMAGASHRLRSESLIALQYPATDAVADRRRRVGPPLPCAWRPSIGSVGGVIARCGERKAA